MKLREIRLKKGLTQRDIALILGVKESAVSKYELDRAKLSHDQIIKLSIALDVTPNELLGFNEAYKTYTEYLMSLKKPKEPH